jgi:peptide/nickel transport system substrate-binding protein
MAGWASIGGSIRRWSALVALALGAAWPAAGLHAQELRVGLASEPTSIDPLYHTLTPNNAVAREIFDTLVGQDERQRMVPALALSWKPVDETTWEFKLRPGVKFHDGAPLTPDDVIFSIDRADKVPNSPGSFGIYTKEIAEMAAVDDLTLRIKTKGPYPLLAEDLSAIAIISKKAGRGKGTSDYNSGAATIGTGPFKFVEFVPGNRIVLERNDAYWGKKPAWARVVERPMPNAPARIAALLAGDVDLIEDVPTPEVASLKKSDKANVVQGISSRVIYLHMDSNRDQSPFVAGKDGKPLDKNPLKDARVRTAISKAINRQAIVDRIMEGVAVPAGQLLPDGFFGVSPRIKVPAYDPEGAKKLLAEAGWPQGFQVTLHGPNNRYINDEKIEQAVAQMLSRIGIDTKVEAMPQAMFFSRASKLDFSLMLIGWASNSGEMSSQLKALLATYDPAKGWGTVNRGRFSDPKLDAVLGEALRTLDGEAREKLLQQGSEIAMDDAGVIPLHFEVTTWASKKGIAYLPNPQQWTIAQFATPEGGK